MQITHLVANLIRPDRDPRNFQNPEHGIFKNLIIRFLKFLKAHKRLLPKALNPICIPKHLTGFFANVVDVQILLQIAVLESFASEVSGNSARYVDIRYRLGPLYTNILPYMYLAKRILSKNQKPRQCNAKKSFRGSDAAQCPTPRMTQSFGQYVRNNWLCRQIQPVNALREELQIQLKCITLVFLTKLPVHFSQ